MKEKIKTFISSEKNVFYTLLALLTIYFLYILLKTEGYIGGADSLTHYRYSRFSWLYPEFLLHHWAKPVFTLLTSPFAQFGHDGVSVFNITAGIFSCMLAYLSARKLGYSYRLLLPFFILFSPIYSIFIISGLTEVLFGLFMIATTYLCLDKKHLWAAILISFSPLVRTEGIMIVPVFALYFMVVKQFRYLPFLFTGFIVYSIIGYFHFNDIFWLITQMPYTGSASAYGTGALTHFFLKSPEHFGQFTMILISIGIIAMIYNFMLGKNKHAQSEVLLIFLPFLIYFLGHVFMWWSGIGKSLGMDRYMVAIVPLGSLLALRGLNVFSSLPKKLTQNKWSKIIFGVAVLAMIFTQSFNTMRNLPRKPGGMDKVMHSASEFIKQEELHKNKIYYNDPGFFYFIGFNPLDNNSAQSFTIQIAENTKELNQGDVLIWDGHFSALRGIQLDSLQTNPYLNELGVFEPKKSFKIFDTDYKVAVFQRNDKQ